MGKSGRGGGPVVRGGPLDQGMREGGEGGRRKGWMGWREVKEGGRAGRLGSKEGGREGGTEGRGEGEAKARRRE